MLLLGETGTGKELLAHGIHAGSARAEQALVTVNVAAIPRHCWRSSSSARRRAPTPAPTARAASAKFELANGGTLLLDEVGDMPLAPRASFAAGVAGQGIRAARPNRIVRADVRIIAATQPADLPALVAAGKFRADPLLPAQQS